MTGLIVGAACLGYLLGSIPFGLLLTRRVGLDIRQVGSGNIGATNVLRTGRKGLAAATLLLDGVKGAAAVLLGQYLLGGALGSLVGGLSAVLGHLFPVWLEFRGGKGVATGFGVLIAANPVIGLAAGAVWIVVAALARMSSAAALAAFAAAPILAVWLDRSLVPLAVCIAVLVYLRHHANIARLLSGTEPRIGNKA